MSKFLSTLSLRRATADAPQDGPQLGFLSTLSLRRATNLKNTASRCRGYFYPRSPCGERPFRWLLFLVLVHFYPRSPCGERQSCHPLIHHPLEFLSTLSLRRATVGFGWNNNAGSVFLSTLSLRRATLNRPTPLTSRAISIHALLAESDSGQEASNHREQQISIHALLAESDTANTGATKSGQISIHALLAESD